MPQPHSFDPPKELPGRHDCPKCGFPMLLAIIEPAEQEGHDKRIFECLICNHIETHVVKFRQT
jgi:transcription elongation factor Elf1